MQFFFFLALAIAFLAIIFTAQNDAPATISLLFWEVKSSLAVVIGVSLFAGAMVSFLVSLPANLKVRWYVRSLQKKIAEMEKRFQEQKERLLEMEAASAANKLPAQPETTTHAPSSDVAEPS